MRIALVANTRPPVQAGRGPDDLFEEFDSPDTVASIVRAIGSLGHDAYHLEAGRDLPMRLVAAPPDLVFNIAEGFTGRSREAHVPAICEWLGVPYTGSDPLTLAVTLDKGVAKRVVSPDVPVARGAMVQCEEEIQGVEVGFPAIVKPNAEGSSKGISGTPIVYDRDEMGARARALLAGYGGQVLVEEFLPGADLTVGIVGNAPPRVLGVMEVAPAGEAAGPFVYGIEEKRDWRRRVAYHVPPRISSRSLRMAEQYALAAYRLLGCRDVARVDLRLDAGGVPRFLEVNPLPGLSPTSGDIVILAGRVGISHQELVGSIIEAALARLCAGAAVPATAPATVGG